MKYNEGTVDYMVDLPVASPEAADRIRTTDESWYHNIKVGDYVTPGRDNRYLWNALADYLRKQRHLIDGRSVLEFGPADGLWSCWLAHLGATSIVGADFRDYAPYRMVIEAFDLPVDYHPNLVSTQTPRVVKGTFGCVVSLGVLYHLHDILTTLMMYAEYLEDGGSLFIETAAVEDSIPAQYFTPDGFILPAQANNQFAPTTGFLLHAMKKLGLETRGEQFLPVRVHPKLGRKMGRYIFHAVKTSAPTLTLYQNVIDSLWR